MKKEYVKPYLALESFQLVAALAGACSSENGKKPLGHSIDTCTLDDSIIFGNACGIGNVHENPELCYNAPVNGGPYLTS